MKQSLTLGTRASPLALWQTERVAQLLTAAWPGLVCRQRQFITQGDKSLDKPLPEIGGKGLFTAELERALHEGEIDLAVHSLKDLPVENPPGLLVGAIVERADVRDVLVAQEGQTLDALPAGAVVGTSSLRRQAQLLRRRPDLEIKSIRGNVATRIGKVRQGQYAATLLAAAGLIRLGLAGEATEWLSLETMLPAPGQGAMAVQCRAGDAATLRLLAAIDDAAARAATTAERTFLAGLGGGCSLPIAAHAVVDAGQIHLTGLVLSVDGSAAARVAGHGDDAAELGRRLAQEALRQGAAEILGNNVSR